MITRTISCILCNAPATVGFTPAEAPSGNHLGNPGEVKVEYGCECADNPAVRRTIYDQRMMDRAIAALLTPADR